MKKSMPHISIEEVVTGQQKTQSLPLITAHLSKEREESSLEFCNLTLVSEAERSKERTGGHWPGAQGVETEYQHQSEEMCPSPEDLTAPKGELGKKNVWGW